MGSNIVDPVVTFNADHPFLFFIFIMDKSTSECLFLGKVVNPQG